MNEAILDQSEDNAKTFVRARQLDQEYLIDPLDDNSCTMLSEYWTAEQTAQYMGKSRRVVQRLLKNGTLHGVKVFGSNGPEWRVVPLVTLKGSREDKQTHVVQFAQVNTAILLLETRIEQMELRVKNSEVAITHLEAEMRASASRIQVLEYDLQAAFAHLEILLRPTSSPSIENIATEPWWRKMFSP